MAVTITRTAWTDDDGSGTTGTIINNAVKTSLYDQIDTALALLSPVAGSTSIVTVGTVTTGVWNAGAVTSSGAINGVAGSFSGTVTTSDTTIVNASSYYDTIPAISTATVIGETWARYDGSNNRGFLRLSAGGGSNAALKSGIDIQGYGGTDSNIVRIFTSGVEVFRAGPTGLITVSGNAATYGVAFDGSAGGGIAATHASGDFRLYARNAIAITIGAAQAVRMHAYGAGTATFDASGNITSVSDARLKDRIEDLGYGLAEVLALRPVRHGYTEASGLDSTSIYGGFLAQDVRDVMPIAVNQNADGFLTLSDRPIIGALVSAVKELAARIAALEGRQ